MKSKKKKKKSCSRHYEKIVSQCAQIFYFVVLGAQNFELDISSSEDNLLKKIETTKVARFCKLSKLA